MEFTLSKREMELALQVLFKIAKGAWGGPDDFIWIDDRYEFTPDELALFTKLQEVDDG